MTMTEYVLWGKHPIFTDNLLMRITSGTREHCLDEWRFRKCHGWELMIVAADERPARTDDAGYRVWHTADLYIPDCEGGCPEAMPCDGGWVDMSWSPWVVHGDRDEVAPGLYDPSDHRRGCHNLDCDGCLTPAEWLAGRLWELPGGPAYWFGGETFYANDTDQEYGGSWAVASRALHAEGFTEDEIRQAWMHVEQWAAALTYFEASFGSPEWGDGKWRDRLNAALSYGPV